MLEKRLINLLATCLFFFGLVFLSPLKAQPTISCPAVNTGNDTILVGPGCANLTAVPVSGAATTTYNVAPIPYTPYPYNGGTQIVLNIDDTYSGLLPLGFDFCFYGFNYNQCVIGTNGILSFDPGLAGGFCPWAINNPIPSPLNPSNCIMAPWVDIDPSAGGTVRFASYGTAPCRTFVVSFETVPMFFNACNNRTLTSQIVLYETTNIIETYIGNKDACPQWNGGNAIHGIHDPTATQATVVPGRNHPNQWTATNDAWRFVPAGVPNYAIQWFEVGNPVSIGNTATINVCPTICETDYYAEVTYTNCNATTLTVTDTVNVSIQQQILPNATQTNVSCNGANDGSVALAPTGGTAPYTYLWIPGNAMTSSITNLGPGNYTVTITDNMGCDTTITYTITEPTAITATSVITAVSCNGGADGTITINNAAGGTPPYQYSLNAGPFQAGNSFTGLTAGTYTVTVRDGNNCTTTLTNLVVTEPPAMNVTTNIVDVICNGGATGSITVTNVTGGSPAYQYSLNAGPFQAGNSFTGLTAGTYSITVRDANNCTITVTNLVVNEPAAITATPVIVDASCNGANDGSIDITNVVGGTPAYQYSLNAGPFQAGATFTGLTAGTYTVTVRDANNCTLVLTNLVVNEPTPIVATPVIVNVSCNGATDGSIDITNVSGGTPGYQYSLNAGPFQGGATFTGLGAGTYTVTVRDANNCTLTLANLVVAEPAAITATPVIVNITCNGANDGSIDITNVAGGTPGYQYSLNAGPFQAGATFTGLGAGTYTVTVRDANNCTLVLANLVVTEPNALVANTTVIDASCNGAADGQIDVINVSGGTPGYQYSLNAGPFQAGNSFTGLTAGTYTITVRDANNCTLVIANVIVNDPAAITATPVIVDVTCNGANDGSIDITNVTGGTPGYQYSLNAGPFQAGATFTGLAGGTYTVTIRDANNCTIVLTNLVVAEPAAITATANLTMVSCNGAADGQIDIVNVNGGTPPYQYSLNAGPFQGGGTFTGLVPGTYTVTVRDANNCTLVLTNLVITEPTAITANDSTITATCQPGMDGEIWIINVGGGVGPYQYSLNAGPFQVSNGFTGLNSGAYTVVVRDANGCTFQLPSVVPSPGNVTGTATPIDATCNGGNDGQITVNPTGGNAPFQFSINAGPFQAGATFTGLTAGAYTITIRDNLGCTTTINVNVGEPAAITATPVIVDATCNGVSDGSIDITNVVGGNPAYQYSLNAGPFQAGNSFTGLAAGTYSVTIRDANNCTVTLTNLVVGEPAAITANTTLTMASCNGVADGQIDVLNVTGGTPAYQYSLNAGPFQASNSFPGLAAGTYSITVRDANNCTLVLTNLVITEPAPIAATDSTVTATCQPGMDGEIWILNVSGGTGPYQYSLNAGPFQNANSFTGLNGGNYTVVVRDANGCTFQLQPVVPTPGNVTATANATDATCNGASDGQITANPTAGNAPFQFSLNAGPFQAGATFTGLAAGAYTITVRDNFGCTVTLNVNVGEPAAITATPVIVDATCNGATDGSIDITNTAGGTGPYQYSLNAGPFQASGTFTGLAAGTYSVTIRDANNCTVTLTNLVVGEPAAISATANLTNASCNGVADGQIDVVNVTGGTPTYQYSLNAGPFQASGTFPGLGAGTYSITVRDANNCTFSLTNLVIAEPAAITATDSTVLATCMPGMDGEIWILNVSGGNGPYQYSLNAGPFQASNSFTGLNGGNYTVDVRDANGCTFQLQPVVPSPGNVTATATATDASCNGGNDGQIAVNPTGGSAPFQFSLNAGPFQAGATFTGLTAGAYTVTVRDNFGCTTTLNVNVGEPAVITATPVITDANCNGASDGSIDITNTAGGTGPYQYSLNAGPFQASGTFNGLAAGTYSVTIRDANNCTLAIANLVVGEPAAITATANLTNASCNGVSDGQIDIVNVSGGTPVYQYSLNAGPFQASGTFPGLAAGTYSVTVRDANNCTFVPSNLVITEPAAITATDSTVTATCQPGMDGEIWILNVSGGTGPYQYSLNAGPLQASNSFTGLNSGPYTVLVQDANGCTFQLQPVVPSPGNVTAADSLIHVTCPGSANGEIWINASSPNLPIQYSLGAGPLQSANNFSGLSGGNYTVNVRDNLGCTVVLNVTINEPAAILGQAVSRDVSCNGFMDGSVVAQNITGGTPPYQYSLNGGAFQAGNSFPNLGPGIYTVVIQDSNGCIDSLAVQTILEPAALSASDSTVTETCNPGSDGQIFILNTAGGIPPYQYSLNSGPFQASNVFNGLSGGSYTVVVQDSNGCSFVLQPTVPTPGNVTGSDSVVNVSCSGGNDGEIWITANTAAPPLQYSLNSGPLQSTGNFTGLTGGSYTVDVEDSLGCSISLNITVTEPAPISVQDSVVMVTCNGAANGEIHLLNTSGGTPPYQYNLNNGPLQTSNTFPGLAPGNYVYQIQDSNGCILTSASIAVTEPQPIVVTDSVTNVTCNGGSDGALTLNSITGGTSPYQISLDSLTWISGTGFTNLPAGSYTVWVRDTNGCTTSLNTLVTEPTPLVSSATAMPATCGNADGMAYASVTGGTAGYSYAWSNGGTTDTINGIPAGTYSVIITDANGCLDSASVTVGELMAPIASVIGTGDISCAGGADGFVVASASGGSGVYSFQWNTILPVNSDSLSGVPAGTYTVIVTDSAGCSDSTSVTLNEPLPMSISVLGIDPACDGGEDGSATATVSGGTPAYDYIWSTFPGQTGSTANMLSSGNYTVTVTDSNGCIDSASVALVNPAPVVADFTANPPMPTQLEVGDAQVTFSNQSQNADIYDWSFGDGGSSTDLDPVYDYLIPGDYCVTLIASDSAGCTDTTEVCNYLVVITEFIIPNTFTPNGDGRNDVFEIVGVNQYPNNHLKVFNRWGNLIYEKEQYDNTWTGTNWKTGDPLPDGAYFYIFTTGETNVETGEEEEYMGDVVIFR